MILHHIILTYLSTLFLPFAVESSPGTPVVTGATSADVETVFVTIEVMTSGIPEIP